MKIVAVKVIERSIVIVTENELLKGSLTNQLELILNEFGFVRLNQNVLVNAESINSFDPLLGIVHVESKDCPQIPVSRRNRSNVPDKFKKS